MVVPIVLYSRNKSRMERSFQMMKYYELHKECEDPIIISMLVAEGEHPGCCALRERLPSDPTEIFEVVGCSSPCATLFLPTTVTVCVTTSFHVLRSILIGSYVLWSSLVNLKKNAGRGNK